MAGLNTVFKQVFGEGLKEQGFVKIKGRQPYLVRVIGDEIIHIVTCRNEWCGEKGYKEFSILGSVSTIYCDSIIDLTLSPHANTTELWNLAGFYSESDPDNYNLDYWESIISFSYKTDDDNSMRKAMEHALKETQKVMMPFLDRLADLESCIDYFEDFRGALITPPKYNENKGSFEDGSREELEHKKLENIEILRSYGLDI